LVISSLCSFHEIHVEICRAFHLYLLQISRILDAVTSICSPQFPSVRISLKMFLLRHATVARRDTFLQAAANFIRDPQIPRVSFLDSPRRPAACFLPLCRFSRPLTGFTTASSLGTSRCFAASGFLSAEVGSSSSGRASIPWQAIVSTSFSGSLTAVVSLWLAPIFSQMALVLALIASVSASIALLSAAIFSHQAFESASNFAINSSWAAFLSGSNFASNSLWPALILA
jgi:hypothetical protein